MNRNLSFLRQNCPESVPLFQRIEREYPFLFGELGGYVKRCSATQYGCEIWVEVQGVLVRFESSLRDGIECGYDIALPVDDPYNKLNLPCGITTFLDFIDNSPPPRYQGPGWSDNRVVTPIQFREALKRVVEFYRSPQFPKRSRSFHAWLEKYTKQFGESVEEYYEEHRS